jgi:sporulation-control protein spo0M
MRGTLFKDSAEYNIDIKGESWTQGETISGEMKVINQGAQDLNLDNIGIRLSWEELKKVKNQDPKAFKDGSLKKSEEERTIIEPNQEAVIPFEFKLEEDCPITDKKGSYYMVYGPQAEGSEPGILQLKVTPRPILNQFLEIFENFFRFKVKEKKSKKGFIEVKMVPPGSKDYMTIVGLNLLMKIEETNLILKYQFNLKNLDYSGEGVALKKKKQVIEQSLKQKEYLFFGDAPNQDGIIQSIQNALDKVKSNALPI